jgi:cas_Csn1: CRISPR-associated protein, Csn1 family
MKNLVILFLIT